MSITGFKKALKEEERADYEQLVGALDDIVRRLAAVEKQVEQKPAKSGKS